MSVPRALQARQVARYERDGVLFPVAGLSAPEVARCRRSFESLVDRLGGSPSPQQLGQCHLHFRWAFDLATHPAILDAVESLIGPDILVHSTTFFYKRPHDPSFVSWHQDGYYWNLSAPRLTSAWVALADSTPENGCLRVIPGSHHRESYPHAATAISEHNLLGSGLEIAVDVEEAQARDVVLRAGEVSFHHVRIVHGSSPNRSDRPRIGFAVRYLASEVSQELEHHAVIVARGRPDIDQFELAARPPERSPEDELAAHVAFGRRLREARHRQGRPG